ncbi:MAG: MBOAT family O-acyltransferase [Acidimicrobiales bacterium]
MASALSLILVGLVKKVVVADNAARAANTAFAQSGSAGFITLAVGVYCFALQIYGDFSGYSDMVRGTARLLGFELMENFEQPYFSLSITEFWRRWHISLSQWLRDYLYIPLGGNRRGARRTYINLTDDALRRSLARGGVDLCYVGGVAGRVPDGRAPVRPRPGWFGHRVAALRSWPHHLPSHLFRVDLLPGRLIWSGPRGHRWRSKLPARDPAV